ncbi:MAG TPA: type 1 glutamine amidotransferase domain-containing protein [Methanoregula sp.]|nr:type 1 glutamine amidotransferase domain-containing protein [Methanoregula sp.]
MPTIAVLITDMFQDIEYQKPADAFRKAGHELTHVGLRAGVQVRGEHGFPLRIDRAVKDVSADDFDALFIPGGYSPDKLRVDDDAIRFVKEFFEAGKPVFAICHAPQILITAQLLKGRWVTGWKSIVQDIKNAGAEYVDKDVVVDRNLVSSRMPADIPAFIRESLALLARKYPHDAAKQKMMPAISR